MTNFILYHKNIVAQIEQTSNSCLVQWRHPIEHGSRVHEYMLETSGATTSMICTALRPAASPSPGTRSSSKQSSHNDEEDESFDKNDDGDDDNEMDSDTEFEAVEENGGDTSSIASSSTSTFSNNKGAGASSSLSDEFMEYRLSGLTADASYK